MSAGVPTKLSPPISPDFFASLFGCVFSLFKLVVSLLALQLTLLHPTASAFLRLSNSRVSVSASLSDRWRSSKVGFVWCRSRRVESAGVPLSQHALFFGSHQAKSMLLRLSIPRVVVSAALLACLRSSNVGLI